MHNVKKNGMLGRSCRWWFDLFLLSVFSIGFKWYVAFCMPQAELTSNFARTIIGVAPAFLYSLLLIHLFCRSGARGIISLLIRALLNSKRDVISKKEIDEQLEVIDPADRKISAVNPTELSEHKVVSENTSGKNKVLRFIRKINPDIESLEAFMQEISKHGAEQYYPIIHRLIEQSTGSDNDLYRIIYVVIADLARVHGKEEITYLKQTLEYLCGRNSIPEKWRFFYQLVRICYADNDYNVLLKYSQQAISSLDTQDPACLSARADLYNMIGSVYIYREEFHNAVPYLTEALRITTNGKFPIAARLALLYRDGLQNYRKALCYAQKALNCLGSDLESADGSYIECRLISLVGYCSAACEDYELGYNTIHNYLKANAGCIDSDAKCDLEAKQAYLLVKLGKFSQASQIAENWLGKKPMDVTFVNVKGMCALNSGDCDTAISCFTGIIPEFQKQAERNAQGRYFLGEIYNNMGICETRKANRIEAANCFQKAFEYGYPSVSIADFAEVSKVAVGQ